MCSKPPADEECKDENGLTGLERCLILSQLEKRRSWDGIGKLVGIFFSCDGLVLGLDIGAFALIPTLEYFHKQNRTNFRLHQLRRYPLHSCIPHLVRPDLGRSF